MAYLPRLPRQERRPDVFEGYLVPKPSRKEQFKTGATIVGKHAAGTSKAVYRSQFASRGIVTRSKVTVKHRDNPFAVFNTAFSAANAAMRRFWR